MSAFVQTLRFAMSFLPSWCVNFLLAAVGILLLIVAFKVVKLIWDAIPFA